MTVVKKKCFKKCVRRKHDTQIPQNDTPTTRNHPKTILQYQQYPMLHPIGDLKTNHSSHPPPILYLSPPPPPPPGSLVSEAQGLTHHTHSLLPGSHSVRHSPNHGLLFLQGKLQYMYSVFWVVFGFSLCLPLMSDTSPKVLFCGWLKN